MWAPKSRLVMAGGGGLAALAAGAEAAYGPLPFALSVQSGAAAPGGPAQAHCVGLPAHRLDASLSTRKPGSNYGTLDAEAAATRLERSLGTFSQASPLVARVLEMPADGAWDRTSQTHLGCGAGVRVWVEVREPKWVGDHLNLVVNVSSPARSGGWQALDLPRRYASICLLEACAHALLRGPAN
mmetsp:Transcript_43961/g.109226  ORF Transcript_43961/g.109226 Transcript_43961/m.109226 type:complete len:184 (+) Transcript_43961:3-554(+)